MSSDEGDITDRPPPERRPPDEGDITGGPPPEGREPPDRQEDEDYYGDVVRQRPIEKMGWLDRELSRSHVVVLVLLALCCNGLAFIMGVVGLAICKDETARRNALILTIVGGALTAVGVLAQIILRSHGH